MGKRKNRAKRSLGSLPKGIPHKAVAAAGGGNPFEFAGRHRAPKQLVHNKFNGNLKKVHQHRAGTLPNDAPLKRRSQHALRESLLRAKKANVFVDRRIGEYGGQMSVEEQKLARLVKERTRRSKSKTKYSLNDDNDNYNNKGMLLTHKGQVIDDQVAARDVLFSDDDDDDNDQGQLDAMDTALHFGGMGNSGSAEDAVYGPSSGGNTTTTSTTGNAMAQNYSQRKIELDDLILRRKTLKAERMKAREQQEDVIADLDGAFEELTGMLKFRDKDQEIRKHIQDKRQGKLDPATQEMEDWNKEIREYTFLGKRVKATDRTKTPEELAKEEAERLHELETRRLARMNGDFSDDDFSDVSDDDDDDNKGGRNSRKKKRKIMDKKKKTQSDNAELLDNSDDDSDDDDDKNELKAKFTADGLVYVNKKGEIVKKLGQDEEDDNEDTNENGNASNDSSDDESKSVSDEISNNHGLLKVGARVQGNYRVTEQFQEKGHWYNGVISKVNVAANGSITYNVDYDDGDFEEDMEPEHVRPVPKTVDELQAEDKKEGEEVALKRKRQKAKDKAR